MLKRETSHVLGVEEMGAGRFNKVGYRAPNPVAHHAGKIRAKSCDENMRHGVMCVYPPVVGNELRFKFRIGDRALASIWMVFGGEARHHRDGRLAR